MVQRKNLFERIPERFAVSGNTYSEAEKNFFLPQANISPSTISDTVFDCPNCLFDNVQPEGNDLFSRKEAGGSFCSHRFYNNCHTWARVEADNIVRIGIDDFGQKVLGPVKKVYLPKRNEKIEAKSIRIMARGATIPLIVPVEGFVEAVNDELASNPQLVNKSPYEKGWFVLLRPTRLAENLEDLFCGSAAMKWFDLEIFKLAALITSELNSKGGEKLSMRLPDGSLPGFELLDRLPPSFATRVMEQCFLYCHTNDKFKN